MHLCFINGEEIKHEIKSIVLLMMKCKSFVCQICDIAKKKNVGVLPTIVM